MTANPPVYSDQPMLAYRLVNTSQCEVSAISALDRAAAVWNLFWLSVPGIDGVVEAGPDWARVYVPTKGVAAAIALDVMEDEVLYRKLLLPPARFAEWFEREKDHSVFDTYEALNGPAWITTVLARAAYASDRIAALPSPEAAGNVYHAVFGKKVA